MDIVLGGRRSGKTTALLDLCIKNNGIFVVRNDNEFKRILHFVHESGRYSDEQLKNFIVRPITLLKQTNYTRGRHEYDPICGKGLYLDDIEFDLMNWIYMHNLNLKGYSMNIPEDTNVHYLRTKNTPYNEVETSNERTHDENQGKVPEWLDEGQGDR